MYFIFETTDGWNLKPRKMELMLKLPNMMVSWIYFYGKLKNLKYWLLENLHDSLTLRAIFPRDIYPESHTKVMIVKEMITN